MARLLAEMRRRNVLRLAAAYLVMAWLVLEIGHTLTLILELPHPTMRYVLYGLVVGFPLVILIGWSFRFVDGALVREADLPATDPAARAEHEAHAAHPPHHGHGHHVAGGFDPLPLILGVLTLGAIGLALFNRGGGDHDAAPAAEHAAPVAEPGRGAGVAAPPNSVAVLPFANLSGDPAQAYFSDGMAEELRDTLAGIDGLQVAARTSSNVFRGRADDIATIAARLGVAYVVDGSVRRAAKVVRVSAQLIDAKSGFARWSQTFDRPDADALAIQSGIARLVADALKVKLLPGEAARLAQLGTRSSPAHDAYLRGRHQFDAVAADQASYRAALADFDAAIAADPSYAAAHAARAATLSIIASQFLPPAAAAAMQREALLAARRAVTLGPGIAATHSALGYVLYTAGGNLAAARAAYARSIAAGGGGDAEILTRYGLFTVLAGDQAAGLAALRKAVALDPVNPRALRQLGLGLYYARRYAEALAVQREALRLNPTIGHGHAVIGDTQLALGQVAAARAEFGAEAARWHALTGLAIAEHRLGDTAAAAAAMQALIAENGDTAIYQQAEVRAQWGDVAGALAALEHAVVVADAGFYYYVREDPLLDPIRRDPRFAALLARSLAQ